jgi:ABC-type uncharacterized transport system permease subunit
MNSKKILSEVYRIKTLMGITTYSDMALGMVVLFIWSMFFRFSAQLLWKKGQYQYTGVGI